MRVRIAIATGLAALALAACGSSRREAATTTTAAPTTTTTAAPTVLGEVLVAPAPELPRTGSDGPRRLGVAGFVMAALGVLLVSLMALVRRRRTMSADRH